MLQMSYLGRIVGWAEHAVIVRGRFSRWAYEDPFLELKNVYQTGSLQDYLDQFDILLNKVLHKVEANDEMVLSWSLGGLRKEIQNPVCMLCPRLLHMAVALARIQEDTLHISEGAGDLKWKPAREWTTVPNRTTTTFKSAPQYTTRTQDQRPGTQTSIGLLPLPHPSKAFTPRPRGPWLLTTQEINEKRAKGLCFLCDEKFSPAHVCAKKRHLYLMEGEEEATDGPPDKWGTEVEGVAAEISLHALNGSPRSHTMCVHGSVGSQRLQIMIDLGSTHTFVDEHIVQEIGCGTLATMPFRVIVANGCVLQCHSVYRNFWWVMQGSEFVADMWVLPLQGYDVILGIQWLKTLGEFKWDLNKHTLKFSRHNKEFVLQGILQEDLRWVGGKKMGKM